MAWRTVMLRVQSSVKFLAPGAAFCCTSKKYGGGHGYKAPAGLQVELTTTLVKRTLVASEV